MEAKRFGAVLLEMKTSSLSYNFILLPSDLLQVIVVDLETKQTFPTPCIPIIIKLCLRRIGHPHQISIQRLLATLPSNPNLHNQKFRAGQKRQESPHSLLRDRQPAQRHKFRTPGPQA